MLKDNTLVLDLGTLSFVRPKWKLRTVGGPLTPWPPQTCPDYPMNSEVRSKLLARTLFNMHLSKVSTGLSLVITCITIGPPLTLAALTRNTLKLRPSFHRQPFQRYSNSILGRCSATRPLDYSSDRPARNAYPPMCSRCKDRRIFNPWKLQ